MIPTSKARAGFTLIELVSVIVILGVIAAVAVPKFVNLSSSAKIAALEGVAGTMKSTINLVRAKAIASGLMLPTLTPEVVNRHW